MLLGPDTTGCFKRVQIKGIHTKSVAVDEVRAGQSASFAVKVVAPGGSRARRPRVLCARFWDSWRRRRLREVVCDGV